MQTVHVPCPPKCEGAAPKSATPSIRALRRTQRSSIALNSFKTS
jgi:hypothetical protein